MGNKESSQEAFSSEQFAKSLVAHQQNQNEFEYIGH